MIRPGGRSRRSASQSRFRELPGFASAETVLLYVKAFPEELDTRDFFADALAAGKRVLCPRVERAAYRLRLFQIRSLTTDLEPGILGIPEPKLSCPEVKPTRRGLGPDSRSGL